jgi:hypothetical protein
MMRQDAPSRETDPQVLNSWKEIAEYMGRGVRTVQRWERDLRLPVHRIGRGKRSPVYAAIAELRFWITTVEVDRDLQPTPELLAQPSGAKPVEEARRLISRTKALGRSIAENSVRHQRQAEALQKRLLEMRSRMKRVG